MNYKQFYCQLPIKDNNVKIIDGLKQYDTANIIHVRLMDGTEPFDFTGYTGIVLDILKPDGNSIQAMVTDDPTVTEDNNPYCIQVVDPKEGRISFTLKGQATVLTGTHFAQLSVYGDCEVLSTSRINYYVGSVLSDNNADVESMEEYSTLRTMLNECARIAGKEGDRNEAEDARKAAEDERESRFDTKMAEINSYLQNAIEYIDRTRGYMEQALTYAQLAQNPSAELLQDIIENLGLASTTYVASSINTATKNFDAGAYTDTDETEKLLKARRGNHADIPILEHGEFGLSLDTKQLYIGMSDGNMPIGGSYIASAEAPARTDILWVDTSETGGGTVKYHDGDSWRPTVTASFA